MQAVLAVLVLAFVGSVDAAGSSAGSSSGNACSTTQQATVFSSLSGLLSTTSVTGCSTDSGYSLTTSTSLPTSAEYAKMCASSNCQEMVKAIIAKNPPDCTITVPMSGLKVNVYELANGFSAKCSAVSGGSTAGASAGTNSTTITTSKNATSANSTTTTLAPTAKTSTTLKNTTEAPSATKANSTHTPAPTTVKPKASSASAVPLHLSNVAAVFLLCFLSAL
ncbi:unnamed protein product [Phytophthora lilii]|uniref:Unnamed protein product n=1 Tax=Phytophthora lilii TaxID=2077276 RepID=A0A9W6X2A5_9STRA|nr:unnamed protein product [Phytophthora lilii]